MVNASPLTGAPLRSGPRELGSIATRYCKASVLSSARGRGETGRQQLASPSATRMSVPVASETTFRPSPKILQPSSLRGCGGAPYGSPRRAGDLDRIGSNSLGLGEPGARSRSGTPIKLYLSACIALISSTAYLACSSNKPATDDDGGSRGGTGGTAGASDAGGSAGDSGEQVGQAGESAT